jgi:hypothetical protein
MVSTGKVKRSYELKRLSHNRLTTRRSDRYT